MTSDASSRNWSWPRGASRPKNSDLGLGLGLGLGLVLGLDNKVLGDGLEITSLAIMRTLIIKFHVGFQPLQLRLRERLVTVGCLLKIFIHHKW